jgi:hypothetical protein
MVLSEARKRALKKYRAKHREHNAELARKYRELDPDARKRQYHANIEVERERARIAMKKRYYYNKEAARLRNILL